MADRRRGSRSRGFTLLEALVALVIFGILTFSLSLALSGAMQAQRKAQQHQETSGAVRVVFGTLSRDLQGAYGSVNSSASVFIAGGGQNSGSNAIGSGSLLTLTTFANRLQAEELSPDAAADPNAQANGGTSPPQSDCALVRYDLDPQSGVLTRTVSTVPSTQAIAQPASGPEAVIANNVISLTLRFWDFNQQSYRDDWDYEQQNQQSQTPSGQATGGTGASNANASNTNASNTAPTGDTTLPGAVEVTLTIRRNDGAPLTYTTLIPIVAPQPQTIPPVNTDTTNGTSNGTSPTPRPGG